MTSQTMIQLPDLPIATLDPDSPVPLYHQIEMDLRKLIQNGNIPSEATLPPEMTLSEAYGVGRHTIRMALSRLVSDGVISRRAGRGTFVKPQPDRTKFFLDRSFTQQMADMGRLARTKVLAIQPGVITEASPHIFADKRGTSSLELIRLRFGDEEPIGIQSSTILTDRCPNLAQQDFQQFGLYDILARTYNLTITEIQHTITAAVADEFQAKSLQIAVGEPLLVVNTTTFVANQQRFEYTISHYRADQYEYSIKHTYQSA
ncbi:MAG: GntR family transcriptional regulator [Chloroflexota bacterium]